MSKFPLVFVLTLNYKQDQITIDCIESILRSSYPNFQILIVDNGSSTEQIERIESSFNGEQRVTIQRSVDNLGYVGGINLALSIAQKANPEYFLIMNNDTLLDCEAISELVAAAQRYDNGVIVTGKVLDYNQPEMIQQIGSKLVDEKQLTFRPLGRNEQDRGQFDQEMEMDMIDDVFWLLPEEVWQKTGYYSDFFWFNCEQADYALRAKKAGYRLLFTPRAKLWHKGSHSIGGRQNNPLRCYWDLKSSLILRYRHLQYFDFLIYYLKTIKWLFLLSLRTMFRYFFKRERQFKVLFANIMGFIHVTIWIFRKRPDKGSLPAFLQQKD